MFPNTIPSMCLILALLKCVWAYGVFQTPRQHLLDAVEEEPIVRTRVGLVRGTVMTSRDNGSFYAFRGIPYAKPPIGNLRFRSPVIADPWLHVFNATEDAYPCAQIAVSNNEDCLVVNVYSKMLPSANRRNVTSLPVLVWIHGGGFSMGYATSYGYRVEPIMDRDVVLVTVAYRLGPLGFLSTGDSSAYGNAGLLDQVMALKWVKDNIAGFGGDPQRIAIFGESAGGVAVGFHLLSPLSRGLFSAAIAESGSVTDPWAIQRNPLQFAIKLGQPFNCSKDDTSLLVECLREQSAADLIAVAYELKDYDVLYLPFVPVIEASHGGSFLQEEPLKLLQEGRFVKVPVISGINRDEGFYIFNLFVTDYNSTYDVIFRDKLEEVVVIALHDDRNSANVTAAVRDEYFSGVDFRNRSAATRAAIDMCSDCYFKAGNDVTVKSLAAAGVPVYMYEFAYAGNASKSNLTSEIEISHGAEVYYLFDLNMTMTESELHMSQTLISMWVNFADKHNPTPVGSPVQWTPSPNGTIRYLRIADTLTMKENYLTDRMHFWNDVVPSILRG